jgi:CRISPR/Cas system type I-B associated protein Csh2 (Cas7 group RAMP superfamily)
MSTIPELLKSAFFVNSVCMNSFLQISKSINSTSPLQSASPWDFKEHVMIVGVGVFVIVGLIGVEVGVMVGMIEVGFSKIVQGVTSLEEVMRATKE